MVRGGAAPAAPTPCTWEESVRLVFAQAFRRARSPRVPQSAAPPHDPWAAAGAAHRRRRRGTATSPIASPSSTRIKRSATTRAGITAWPCSPLGESIDPGTPTKCRASVIYVPKAILWPQKDQATSLARNPNRTICEQLTAHLRFISPAYRIARPGTLIRLTRVPASCQAVSPEFSQLGGRDQVQIHLSNVLLSGVAKSQRQSL